MAAAHTSQALWAFAAAPERRAVAADGQEDGPHGDMFSRPTSVSPNLENEVDSSASANAKSSALFIERERSEAGWSYDEDSLPDHLTVYPDTDCEGEPVVKAAHELWPGVSARRRGEHRADDAASPGKAWHSPPGGPARRPRVSPGQWKRDVGQPVTPTSSPAWVGWPQVPFAEGQGSSGSVRWEATLPTVPNIPHLTSRQSDPRDPTTLMVRNIPDHVAKQDFLNEMNASGFAGSFDFAYLPCHRDTGRAAGHAFVNFKSPDLGRAFREAWHGSARFGVGLEDVTLNVAPSALQGLRANVGKWSSKRVAQVKNAALLPFVERDHGPATTLVVRNLPEHVIQQDFLDEVNRAGFVGRYDFAYLPRDRESLRGSGIAFVNFGAAGDAAAFAAAWHNSLRFGARRGEVPLNVVPSRSQGYRATVKEWTDGRLAQVRNPALRPFILGTPLPAPMQAQR